MTPHALQDMMLFLLRHMMPSYLRLCTIWTCMALSFSTSQCPDDCTCTASDAVQINCANIGFQTIPNTFPPDLSTLDLSENEIEQLTSATMTNIQSVVNLKLKMNKIERIEDGSFHALSELQTLDLSSNVLTNIHQGTFTGASSLLHIDLSANQLATIDGAFADMRKLTRLNLGANKIKRLTQFTFRDLDSLRYLLIPENQISHIDRRAFRNLERLMYLVLKDNPIGNADNIQFNSNFLSYLDLSECGLRYVPNGLPNSIRYLQLRRNNMSVIHRVDLAEVPYVSILVLDENGITFIEDGTFAPMIYLLQLWLNGNRLTIIPRLLPSSLQRLLMDSNQIGAVTDIFPDDSKLGTLSLMGNNISYISPYAFRKLPELKTLDLSNNLLHGLYSESFINSTQLRTLQLSKNPIMYFYSNCFDGLHDLRTLTLAYVDANATLHDNIFKDLLQLKKLDLDSSPGIVWSIFTTEELLDSLRSVQDLSLQSAELTHLRSDFPLLFPQLAVLHITSTRWHCDTSMMWFKQWLLTTSVQVETSDDIVCATPRSLYGKPIKSLDDKDFVAATTIDLSTTFKTFPPVTSPTAASNTLHDKETNDVLPYDRVTPFGFQGHSLPPSFDDDFHFDDGFTRRPFDPDILESSGFGEEEDILDEIDFGNVKPQEPPEGSPRYETSTKRKDPDSIWGDLPSSNEDRDSDDEDLGPNDNSHSYSNRDQPHSNNTNRNGVQIHVLPSDGTHDPSLVLGHNPHEDSTSESEKYGPTSLLIVIATSVATVIIVAILVTAIVLACRKRKNKDIYTNAVKYQQRNDVLYFMPEQEGQEGSLTDSLKTTASREQMSLVPGRDINHEGPLRVYKWEDF